MQVCLLPVHKGPNISEHFLHRTGASGAYLATFATGGLQKASEAFKQALRLMHCGDNHRATYALLRAEADATWAFVSIRGTSAQAEAIDAFDQVQSFQQEHAL